MVIGPCGYAVTQTAQHADLSPPGSERLKTTKHRTVQREKSHANQRPAPGRGLTQPREQRPQEVHAGHHTTHTALNMFLRGNQLISQFRFPCTFGGARACAGVADSATISKVNIWGIQGRVFSSDRILLTLNQDTAAHQEFLLSRRDDCTALRACTPTHAHTHWVQAQITQLGTFEMCRPPPLPPPASRCPMVRKNPGKREQETGPESLTPPRVSVGRALHSRCQSGCRGTTGRAWAALLTQPSNQHSLVSHHLPKREVTGVPRQWGKVVEVMHKDSSAAGLGVHQVR